jgi:hypothetical protein
MSLNKNGLARDIPENVKRSVRKRCGFGCVVCGNPFIQYDHFNPEFAEAVSHDPEGITLLCGSCHDKKSKGILSTETVAKANNDPYPIRKGLAWGNLDMGTQHPVVTIGGNFIQDYNEPLISIKPPENKGEIFRFNVHLKDNEGGDTLIVKDNEVVFQDGWDVIWRGPEISIKANKGLFALVMRLTPPREIHFDKVEMLHKDYQYFIDPGGIRIVKIGTGEQITVKASNNIFSGSNSGIIVSEAGVKFSF